MWRLCDLRERIRISPGFCLLAAWFTLGSGWELLGTVLGAAALHELGHCGALRLLGVPVTGLRIGIFGAELAAVLAGPGANLLCALLLTVLGGTRWVVFTGANLVLCVFNLVPVRPLDGGRALYLLAAWAAGPAAGEIAARWTSMIAALALSAALVFVMVRTGGSLWLLPAAAGLLAAAGRELAGQDFKYS